MAFGNGDGANRQLGSALLAASGAAMLLGGIAVFALGGTPILGWMLLIIGVADLGIAVFIRTRG